jgi:uncharacterized membrane protein YphA (DoxX/SURF4 family)
MTTQTIDRSEPSSSRLTTAARLTMGGVFLLSGLNGVFGLLPLPTEGPGGAFLTALVATGYQMPILRALELTLAALLLSGRTVPLALVLAAPLVVNIAAFHLFLAPQGLAVVAVLLLTGGHLAWRHRHALRSLLLTGRPAA